MWPFSFSKQKEFPKPHRNKKGLFFIQSIQKQLHFTMIILGNQKLLNFLWIFLINGVILELV